MNCPLNSPRDHDPRIGTADLSHKIEKLSGVPGMEPDASVRGRTPQPLEVVGAVYGVSAEKEDRIGHGCPVVLARVPVAFQPGRAPASRWCAISLARSRNRPFVSQTPVDVQIKPLFGKIDLCGYSRCSACAGGSQDKKGQQQRPSNEFFDGQHLKGTQEKTRQQI